MTEAPALEQLLQRLEVEEAPDPRCLLSSNAALHHDRAIGAFLDACSPEALALLLSRAKDPTPVHRPGLPGPPVLGGYGKAVGPVTVADKVRFAVQRLLGALAEEALAEGPAWVRKQGPKLKAEGRSLRVS